MIIKSNVSINNHILFCNAMLCYAACICTKQIWGNVLVSMNVTTVFLSGFQFSSLHHGHSEASAWCDIMRVINCDQNGLINEIKLLHNQFAACFHNEWQMQNEILNKWAYLAGRTVGFLVQTWLRSLLYWLLKQESGIYGKRGGRGGGVSRLW